MNTFVKTMRGIVVTLALAAALAGSASACTALFGPESPPLLGMVGLAQGDSIARLMEQGERYELAGAFVEAERVYKEALSTTETLQSEPLVVLGALDGLATVWSDEGRYADAERILLRALSIAEHAAGPTSETTAQVLWHLGDVYMEAGMISKAGPFLRRYEATIKALGEIDPIVTSRRLQNLGDIYMARRSSAKALALFRQAVAVLEGNGVTDGMQFAGALLNRAAASADCHRFAEALADVQRALPLTVVTRNDFPQFQIEVLITSGMIYAQAHKPVDAERQLREGLIIAEKRFGPDHPIVGIVLRSYAAGLRKMRRGKEALEFDRRADLISSNSGLEGQMGASISALTLSH